MANCRCCYRAITKLQDATNKRHVAAGATTLTSRGLATGVVGVHRCAAEVVPSASAPEDLEEGMFDWLDQWYLFVPVCNLDLGALHGKTVLGHSVVA